MCIHNYEKHNIPHRDSDLTLKDRLVTPLLTPKFVSRTHSIVFANFKPVFEPVLGACMMNVQNEPLHDMGCVVKRGTPPR